MWAEAVMAFPTIDLVNVNYIEPCRLYFGIFVQITYWEERVVCFVLELKKKKEFTFTC